MKAIVLTEYGPPDVLQLADVEKPIPKDNEVLIKVQATSVNDWDWGLLRGQPFVSRLVFGLLKPKIRILGCDVAGRVEAVGSKATLFQVGDEVFGDLCACGFGSFAEYVCADEKALAQKPTDKSFEQVAAIPQAGLLALQGLQDKRQTQPGDKVLINGAGGGAGTVAIQLAKLLNAEVTGVDSTRKLDLMLSIGADHVIDYTQKDFTKNEQQYDLILDFAAHHSIFDYKRALSRTGAYVMVGGASARIIQAMFLGPLISMAGGKKMGILAHKPNKGLVYMRELLETGKVVPVIDRYYPLDAVPEALRYFGDGNARGKVIIKLDQGKQ